MKKLRILIDVDGIVANTLPYWLGKIAQRTKLIAQVEDIKEWDLCKAEPLKGADPKVIFGMLNDQYFMINVPVMFGAKEAIKQLQDDGHEIVFVTARTGYVSMPETLEWFHRHFPNVNTEKQVAFLYDKQHMLGDVLIDDKPATLEAYKAKHPHALTVGIKYPYNQHLGPEHKLFGESVLDMTLTWGSIYACIKGHAEALHAKEAQVKSLQESLKNLRPGEHPFIPFDPNQRY
jgi:5'(3')-deoxyribonucleotidase